MDSRRNRLKRRIEKIEKTINNLLCVNSCKKMIDIPN